MYRIDYLLCNSDRAIDQRTGARRGRAKGIKYGEYQVLEEDKEGDEEGDEEGEEEGDKVGVQEEVKEGILDKVQDHQH